jgi:hypothetical protein
MARGPTCEEYKARTRGQEIGYSTSMGLMLALLSRWINNEVLFQLA